METWSYSLEVEKSYYQISLDDIEFKSNKNAHGIIVTITNKSEKKVNATPYIIFTDKGEFAYYNYEPMYIEGYSTESRQIYARRDFDDFQVYMTAYH